MDYLELLFYFQYLSFLYLFWDLLVAQMIKSLPAMWATWVWSLSQDDPLEKEMATHPSILAWRIPWMTEPGINGVAKSQTWLSDFSLIILLL